MSVDRSRGVEKSDETATTGNSTPQPPIVSLDPSLFATMIEASDRVFFAMAADFSELYYLSPSFERVFGLPRDKLFADPREWLETVHPDDRETAVAALNRRLNDPTHESPSPDFRIVPPDGRLRWVRGRSFVCRHNGRAVLSGLIEDVTALHDAEAASLRRRDRLESTVRDRTAELTALNELLRRENERRAATEAELLKKQAYLEELLRLQEWERRLVSFEIHDGAIQNVVAARMQVDAAAAGDIDVRTRQKLDEAGRLLRTAVDESRRVIEGLRPQVLDDLGLKAAIEDLIDRHQRGGLEIEFRYSLGDLRHSPFIETTVYRIVQEALTNVQKHAGTRQARVELRSEADRGVVIVADEGRGFDVNAVFSGRFGLRGLRERVQSVGGTITIARGKSKGTVVEAHVPLMDPAAAAAAERDRAEAALRLARLRMQAILDETTAVIFVKDHRGRYELINRRYEDLFDVKRDEFVGKTDYEVFPSEVARVLQENDQRVRDTAVPLTLEEAVPSGGAMRDYISVKFLIPGEHGGPPSVCGIATDITERKRELMAAAAGQETFQSFFDRCPIPAWIKDAAGRYVYVNRHFLAMQQFTREQALGRTDEQLYGPELAAEFRRRDLEVLADGRARQYDETAPPLQGESVVLRKVKFLLRAADGTMLVGGVGYRADETSN